MRGLWVVQVMVSFSQAELMTAQVIRWLFADLISLEGGRFSTLKQQSSTFRFGFQNFLHILRHLSPSVFQSAVLLYATGLLALFHMQKHTLIHIKNRKQGRCIPPYPSTQFYFWWYQLLIINLFTRFSFLLFLQNSLRVCLSLLQKT